MNPVDEIGVQNGGYPYNDTWEKKDSLMSKNDDNKRKKSKKEIFMTHISVDELPLGSANPRRQLGKKMTRSTDLISTMKSRETLFSKVTFHAR